MTMELGYEFSLTYDFRWEDPISDMVQQSIATYGCDEDRIHLAGHFSVSGTSLEAMSLVDSDGVRLAVASQPGTSPEVLARLTHDQTRAVRSVAIDRLSELPANVRLAALAATATRFQRFKKRLIA